MDSCHNWKNENSYQNWKQMDRKFGYSKIKWKIDDYDLSSIFKRWTISSPQFCIRGRRLTEWQMELRKNPDSSNILFTLRLINDVPNSYELIGECELCISDKEIMLLTKEFHFLGHSSSKTVKLEYHLLTRCGQQQVDSNSSLTLELDIFVRFGQDEEDVAPCKEASVKLLSDSLFNLFENKLHSDVELYIGDRPTKTLLAHKAILHFRNTKLGKFISQDERIERFYFDAFPRVEACKKILRFLYSASMKHVLDLPMKSVFELASTYDISPITAYFAPDKLTLCTEVITERLDTKWFINETLLKTEGFVNPVILDIHTMSLKLKLYPVSFGKINYVGVAVEFPEGKGTAVFVEIFLRNTLTQRIHPKVYKTQNKKLEDCKFLDKSKIDQYVYNGTLILGFRVRWISSDNCVGRLETRQSVQTDIVTCKPYCEQANYIQLCKDMSKLYNSKKYQNRGFKFSSKTFTVNLGIVSARCLDFYNVVKDNDLENLDFFKAEVIDKLIKYMYCCENWNSFETEELLSCAVFAEKYQLHKLKTLLLHIFERLLEVVDETSKKKLRVTMGNCLQF